MKYVKKIVFILAISTIILNYNNVQAQRGCCSWHGGVSGSCRNGKIVCNDGTTSPSCTCSGGSTNTPSAVYGCTDSDAINYNPRANTNDGSCIKKVYGCTDKTAYNYNANANTNDGSCIKKVYGCTDESAYNYNPDANTDNNTCIAKVNGCTNRKAKNYDVKANTDDGSCLYTRNKVTYKKIKYKTKYKYKLLKKEGKVIQKGKNGKKKITIEETVDEAGNIIESKVVKTEIEKKATDKIIVTKKKKK